MVTNASMGGCTAVEPLIETGSNFYARAWYLFLGTVARILLAPVPFVLGTFAFLGGEAWFTSKVAAAWALVRWRHRIAIVLSILLLPAIPGLILLLVRAGPIVLAYFGIAVLAAAPQVVFTVLGIASDDPFLSSRVASNQNLGVEPGSGLLGAVVLLLPLASLAAAGVIRRPLWIAYPIGAATTWFILATNDVWGPNAEPYRLWIDSFLLVAVGLLPLFVTAAIDLARPGESSSDRAGAARGLRVGTAVVAALVAVTAVASATDWVRFYQDDEIHGVFIFTDSRSAAHSDLATRADDGSGDLVGMDTCVDPQIVKLNSGAPVAFYNLGMAWPEERDAVQSFLADRAEGDVDLDTLRVAGIGWMLTDSACGDGWEEQFDAELDVVDRAVYDGGVATLWRVPAP